MKNVPTNLSNLKGKVDKLDVDKLVPVPFDLSELSDVVKSDLVIYVDIYNADIKIIEDKIPDITNFATNTTLNAKINEVKNKIPSITNLDTNASLNAKINEVKCEIASITNLAATSALTAVENKTFNFSDLVKKAFYDAEVKDIKDEYFTTSDYNNFTNNILDEKITAKKLVNESVSNEKIKTLIINSQRRNKKISNKDRIKNRAR